MPVKKLVWITGAAALAMSCASTGGAAVKKGSKITEPYPITAQEKAEGAKAHPQILEEFGGAWQSPQTDYVVRVGKNIAVQSGLGNAQDEFTVTLLNSQVNNAFAIPGGYIYITRQLVALCNSEAEMAGVLGHEVGHVAARHSKKRQRKSTLAGILGAVGAIGGALLGDNGGILGALGGAAQQYSGTLAQLFITLPFSRGQEEEADDLGIRYLSRAGYDPLALSDMLNSLALQTSLDLRLSGQGGGSVPEWASTHPDPAKRVVRAATGGRTYPASSLRRQNEHFAAIDNMLYGDDPKEGIIEGRDFVHPTLRLKFTAPSGYSMNNGARAVSINGNGGRGLFTSASFDGDRQAYMDAAFQSVAGEGKRINHGPVSRTTVNGIPAFYADAAISDGRGGRNILTVFAYEFAADQAFHFVMLAPGNGGGFDNMYQSMRRITADEASKVKSRKVKIVSVGSQDNITTLSAKMAYDNYRVERFLALNGLRSDARLQAGAKVKIITY